MVSLLEQYEHESQQIDEYSSEDLANPVSINI
jgi:hypothetical protein